ncbi:MAG: lipopolysaccharide biosynthesis protein [Clostridium sp.]|nr:lipopolysaccharide biosynthesis protein [Clostridium sp.]
MNYNVFSNFIWRFLERFGAKGVEFIVSILLARLLAPDVYGTIALVTVFTTILNVFVDSGFGNALIQKKDADELDFSSVFYFNIVICSLLYIGMFFAAPLIAQFYDMPDLTPVVRVLSLTLIISGVKNIQQAYVSKNMLFKRFFFATLGGTLAAAIVGIAMAYVGLGVWALVAQQLVNATIDTVILWITVKWRPKAKFSFQRLCTLLNYGWKLLASSLLDTVYKNVRQLVIGKFYSAEDLAFYNQGNKYPNLLTSNINSSIDSVLLPVMSKEQDDVNRVRSMTRRSIQTSIFIMAPIMCGMCATASKLISIVLTDKWLPCVPFFQVFCITYIFYPVHTANLNAIKALGRSDVYLKLEIVKKIEGAVILLATVWFGPFVMAASGLITTWISQMINAWPNKRLLNYSYKQQLFDFMPSLLLAGAMGVIVFYCGMFLPFSNIINLVIQVAIGVIIYIGGASLFKMDIFIYIKGIVKRLFVKKK